MASYAIAGYTVTEGYGDPATWPACTNHPNDPRTEPDERDWDELCRDERRARLAELSHAELVDEYLFMAADRDRLLRRGGQ